MWNMAGLERINHDRVVKMVTKYYPKGRRNLVRPRIRLCVCVWWSRR